MQTVDGRTSDGTEGFEVRQRNDNSHGILCSFVVLVVTRNVHSNALLCTCIFIFFFVSFNMPGNVYVYPMCVSEMV